MQTVTNRIWVLTLLPAWPFSQLKTDLLLSSGLGEELKRLGSKFLTQHRLIVICRLDPLDPLKFTVSDICLIWRNDPPDDVFRIGRRIQLGK